MTDRNDGRPRHSASHMHCAVPFFCARSGTEGEAAWRCGEWIVGSAGNASHSLRACVGAAWGSGSAREGRVAVRGRAESFGGEWVVRSAGNGSRSLRACVGAAWACVGAAWGAEVLGEGVSLCGGGSRSSTGMGCEGGGFNALSPQRLARTRIIIYTSALPAP